MKTPLMCTSLLLGILMAFSDLGVAQVTFGNPAFYPVGGGAVAEALGDFNNDGNLDVLILNMGEPPSLLKNEGESGNHWLSVKLAGTKSNRSAIGARIALTAGGRRQIRDVLSGSSYISQSDLRQHFGLGAARRADEVEVRWLSGQVDRVKNIDADQFIRIEEGRGLVKI